MTLLKKSIPHVLAIAIGLLLVVLFFSPLIFENKAIIQNDVEQGINAGMEIIEFREKTGEEALWTNSMFSGMPAYLINVVWSGELMDYVQKIISVSLPSSAQVIFLSFLSFYLLLISFGVRPLLAFAGAIAYSFNTFNLVSVEAGHIWKVRAIAYMPLVLAGVHLVFTHSKKLLAVAILSIAVALEIKANHLQITYYLFITLLVYGAYQLFLVIRSGEWAQFGKNVALLLLAAVLGIGANAGRLWSTMEYGKYSTRGQSDLTQNVTAGEKGLDKDYVFNWSYGITESLTLIIPNFSGGATTEVLKPNSNLGTILKNRNLPPNVINQQLSRVPTYWGDQPFTSGPTYVGAILFLLVILSFFWVDPKIRNWLLIAMGLSLFLSWGKNLAWFNDFFYQYFPAYNKFRSVSMAMTILLLTMPLLGILGLEGYLNDDSEQKHKQLVKAFFIAGGSLVILIIIGKIMSFKGPVDAQLNQMPDWYIDALRDDRRSMMINDTIRGLILISFVFIALYSYTVKKINISIAGVIIAGLVCFDFWFVGKRFIKEENYQRVESKNKDTRTAADKFIHETESGHYRVLNLLNPFNEAQTSAQHNSLGGYHGAKMKRYQELIDYCLGGEVSRIISGLQSGTLTGEKLFLYNMLNAKFIKFGDEAGTVMPNDDAWGNAWFSAVIVPANSADEEIARTCSLKMYNNAVVNTTKFTLTKELYSMDGLIRLESYAPNKLVYKSDNSGEGFAVFSEIYYPEGWVATIDGEVVPIIQANYVLRALEIPAGQHEIVFEFKPDSYFVGNKISLLFSILILGLFGLAVVKTIREN